MTAVIKIDEQSNGKTITLMPGQTLIILLSENPTTGYRWAVESSGMMTLEDNKYISDLLHPGAAGIRQMQWRGSSPGHSQIIIKKKREWDKSNIAIESFSLIVNCL